MYTYDDLISDVALFRSLGADAFSIGRSAEGRDVWCFAAGCGGKPVLSTAAIHARENASAYVVRKQLLYALQRGVDVNRQYFIPLVNPDGAEILRRWYECGDETCRLWKANACGVDLNVNFDARWGTGAQNVFSAGAENYVGPFPFSEPESAALARFTEQCGAGLTLSYHTAGRELYWYFHQRETLSRDFALAAFIESELLFRYKRVDSDLGSAGGYKDFCVEKLGIPAFTIELGEGTHPLSYADVREDVALNESLVYKLTEKLKNG